MSNIMLEECPCEWNGFKINTWYQIGLQITQLYEDNAVPDSLKAQTMIYLLFGNEDDTVRDFPQGKDLEECISWFLNGWNMDNTDDASDKKNEKLIDYDIDQGRIFADFLQIYSIDLRFEKLHWWEFNWLLWNMPRDRSSFMQVIEIRTKKPTQHTSAQERIAINKAKKIFGLKQPEQKFTSEEKKKIDEYDNYLKGLKENIGK